MYSVKHRWSFRTLVAAIAACTLFAASSTSHATTVLVDSFEAPSPGGSVGSGFQVSGPLGATAISPFRSTNEYAINGQVNGTYAGALSWSMNSWGPALSVAWGITSLNTLATSLGLNLSDPSAAFEYDVQVHSGYSTGRVSLEVRDGSGASKSFTFGQGHSGSSDYDNSNTALPNGGTYSIPLSVYSSFVDLTDVAGLLFSPTAGGWQSTSFPNTTEVGAISEIRLTNVGAVPEPSSLLLAGIGLIGLAGLAWKRKA